MNQPPAITPIPNPARPGRSARFQQSWFLVAVWVWMIYALSGPEFAGAKTDPTIVAQVQSAAPRLNHREIRQVTYFLRKHAHVAVYAMLVLLLAWAMSGCFPPQRPTLRTAALVLLLVAAIASLDEWHQSFVPGRHGRGADVLIDLTGATLALLALRLFGRKSELAGGTRLRNCESPIPGCERAGHSVADDARQAPAATAGDGGNGKPEREAQDSD